MQGRAVLRAPSSDVVDNRRRYTIRAPRIGATFALKRSASNGAVRGSGGIARRKHVSSTGQTRPRRMGEKGGLLDHIIVHSIRESH